MPEIIIRTKNTLRNSLRKNETHFLCSYTCPLVFMVAQRIRQELATLYIHFETCLFNDHDWFFCKHAKLFKVSYSQSIIKHAFHMPACMYSVMCVIDIILHKSIDTSLDLTEYILIILELVVINS